MDENKLYGALGLQKYVGRNLMMGLLFSIAIHLILIPGSYLVWLSLFREEAPAAQEQVRTIRLEPIAKLTPPKPKPKNQPAPASAGRVGERGGGTPSTPRKPSMNMKIEPMIYQEPDPMEKPSVNTNPVPTVTVPDFPNMIAKPIADPIPDPDLAVQEPGFMGGARQGEPIYGGPDIPNSAGTPYRGQGGGPPSPSLSEVGGDLGNVGSGRGGLGDAPGGGIGGIGAGSGAGGAGSGRGTGAEGLGRGLTGKYQSAVGQGGEGSLGVDDGERHITEDDLSGLIAWLRKQKGGFPHIVRAYLETGDRDLCGITRHQGWDIFVQFSESAHQLKIFLTQGTQGILLADSDFKQRSQYFGDGRVSRSETAEITAIEAMRDKPSAAKTDEFYRVFGDWMRVQGISMGSRASR